MQKTVAVSKSLPSSSRRFSINFQKVVLVLSYVHFITSPSQSCALLRYLISAPHRCSANIRCRFSILYCLLCCYSELPKGNHSFHFVLCASFCLSPSSLLDCLYYTSFIRFCQVFFYGADDENRTRIIRLISIHVWQFKEHDKTISHDLFFYDVIMPFHSISPMQYRRYTFLLYINKRKNALTFSTSALHFNYNTFTTFVKRNFYVLASHVLRTLH